MNKTFNINDGEIMILKDTSYDEFLKNGNKIVTNQKINPIYSNVTNKEIPIRLAEGNYNSAKLTDNKIYTPNFQTLILGPMTKIEITYADSKIESRHNYKSDQKVSSNLVLSNLSPNTISVYQTKDIYITDLGNSIMNIKVMNERKNPNALNQYKSHQKWEQKLKETGQVAEISELKKEKPCMNLGVFLTYITIFLIIMYILSKVIKKFNL